MVSGKGDKKKEEEKRRVNERNTKGLNVNDSTNQRNIGKGIRKFVDEKKVDEKDKKGIIEIKNKKKMTSKGDGSSGLLSGVVLTVDSIIVSCNGLKKAKMGNRILIFVRPRGSFVVNREEGVVMSLEETRTRVMITGNAEKITPGCVAMIPLDRECYC